MSSTENPTRSGGVLPVSGAGILAQVTRESGAPRGTYGPEDRHLLETTAARIYTNAVSYGSLPDDDPRLTEEDAKPALALLLDIGLLRHDETTGDWELAALTRREASTPSAVAPPSGARDRLS